MATLSTTITYSEPTGSLVATLGAPGPSGQAATIEVGTTSTSAPGSDAYVVNVGTSSAAILDFTIPRGTQGPQGVQGIPGEPGQKGDKGDQGDPGAPGVIAATSPLIYDAPTQTVSISSSPAFDSISIGGGVAGFSGTELFLGDGVSTNYLSMSAGLVMEVGPGIFFPDSTIQSTAGISQTFADGRYAPIAAGVPSGGGTSQILSKASAQSYDLAWTTLIPGDRYLTTSITSNAVSNGAKTFAVSTGLSYSPNQDVTISYDASNHMHAVVTSYNSTTGSLVVDVRNHTGSGTYSNWVINVGGAIPAASVAWGSITGQITNQVDLQASLDSKYPTSNPDGFITSSALTPYLTSATAASTYYPLTNPAGYITSSALTPYLLSSTAASTYFTISSAAGKANLSGATFTGKVNLATISASSPGFNIGGQCDPAPASAVNGDVWISTAVSPKLTYRAAGVNYNLAVLNQFNTFTGQVVIDTTSSTTSALRITQKGTGNAIEVEDSTTPDATRFVVDQFGKMGVGTAPDTNAAIKVDGNGIMFGDGTTQTTAALPPVPPSPIIAFANTIASQITSLTWNINTDGSNATIQFTFNLNNASVINRMNQSCGQSTYLSCTFDNGFGFTQTVWCPITGPLSSVTTTDFSESFQYSIGLNGTIRVKLGNDLGYVFYDITL